jgi:hypothetical protein
MAAGRSQKLRVRPPVWLMGVIGLTCYCVLWDTLWNLGHKGLGRPTLHGRRGAKVASCLKRVVDTTIGSLVLKLQPRQLCAAHLVPDCETGIFDPHSCIRSVGQLRGYTRLFNRQIHQSFVEIVVEGVSRVDGGSASATDCLHRTRFRLTTNDDGLDSGLVGHELDKDSTSRGSETIGENDYVFRSPGW